jgi:hypothetical protein
MQRTPSQIEASRRNGAKSRGPVTAEGKARVSQNGVKHGIYSQTVILENEDPDIYTSWRDDHLAEWEPATNTEYNLVIDIVDARWRLRRLSVLETKALDFEIARMRPEIDDGFGQMDEGTRTVFGLNSLLTLNRTFEVIQTSIRTQHRIIDRATAQLLKLGKIRRRPEPAEGNRDDDGPGGLGSHSLTCASDNAPGIQPPDTSTDADCGDQTRAAAPEPGSTAGATQNQEIKPGPARIDTPVCRRAVFDPALDTGRRAHPGRLRAA